MIVRRLPTLALGAASLAIVLSSCTAVPQGRAPVRAPVRMISQPVVQQTGTSYGASAETGGYVVRAGDTLSGIADRFGVDMVQLAQLNGIPTPYLIRIGERLRLPPRGPSITRPSRIPMPTPAPAPVSSYAAVPAPFDSPAPSNPAPPPPPPTAASNLRVPGAPHLVWPIDGAMAVRYGQTVDGGPNKGIDLNAYEGMAVRSAAAGTVVYAGHEAERFGNTVIVDHGNGWLTAYGYLGKLTVSVGEKVRQRTRIAFAGKSGAAKHTTVHFEVRHDNVPYNPELYLPKRL